jgi:predicted nucleotidyltransferase
MGAEDVGNSPDLEVSLMRRNDVLFILRTDQPRLRAEFGVRWLALFGSVARDEATAESDVDLLVEYEPERRIGLLRHIGTAQHLEKLLNVNKVDLILRESVVDELKDSIYGEALDVFGTNSVEVPSPAHAGSRGEDPTLHAGY